MALYNIPNSVIHGCADLKVNMSIAAGIGAPAGDAATYGAFQVAMDMSNSAIHNAINPLDCANHIYLDGSGIPKVTLEYHLPDCSPIADACGTGFDCSTGVSAAPSVQTTTFSIDQCSFFKLTINQDLWENTCCGVEEYYKQIAQARNEGGNLDGQLRGIVQGALDNVAWSDYSYKARLIAERVQRTMNDPISGKLAEINEYVLDKLEAGKGWNYTKTNAGAVVGAGTWTLPVLVPRLINNCATGEKTIDAYGLARQIERLIAADPTCGQGFRIIGGDYFRELQSDLGIISCCDDKGVDQGAAVTRALGLLRNMVYDSTIDAKFGAGTFFLVKEASIEMFWLNLFSNPGYLTPQKAFMKMGGNYKWQHKNALNDFAVTRFNVANCRTGSYGLPFDTFFTTPMLTDGCQNPSFNFQFNANYALWTRPQFDCGNFKGTTGILKGMLVDAC